jgi:hypothetical protein
MIHPPFPPVGGVPATPSLPPPNDEGEGIIRSLPTKGHQTESKRFIYYQEDELFVGWLEEYPDYRTQGETMDELKQNLQDIHAELTSGQIPCVHKVGVLSVA